MILQLVIWSCCDGVQKQRVPENDPENDPLQDFIRKQAAYFAEVDAFELPVEVVSDSESE